MSSVPTKTIAYTSAFSPIEINEQNIALPLKPYQLVVKTSHIALNPADTKVKPVVFIPGKYRLGMEFAGVVEHVGSDLTSKYRPGDRVCGFNVLHGFVGSRSLVDTRYAGIMSVPRGLTDEEAAAFPLVLTTAQAMFDLPKLTSESTVLVLGGASCVGAFVLQLLKKYYKVSRVVSVNSASSNEFVRSFGADDTIDYKTGDLKTSIRKYVAEHGRFQAVLDTVGGTEVLNMHSEILNSYQDGAAYVSCAGDIEPGHSYKEFMWHTFTSIPRMLVRILFGQQWGMHYALIAAREETFPGNAKELFEEYHFKVPIDTVYALEDYKAALDKVEGVRARGKILIKFNHE